MNAHLDQRSNGSYQFRYRPTIEKDGKKVRTTIWLPEFGTFSSTTAPGVKGAAKKVEKHMRQLTIQMQAERRSLIEKMLTKRSTITAAEWLTDCMNQQLRDLEAERIARNNPKYGNKKRPVAAYKWALLVWGRKLRLEELTYDNCLELQKAMLNGYGDKKAIGKDAHANYLSCISQWLDLAVRKELIAANHVRALKKPRDNYIDAHTKDTLTREEWQRVFAISDQLTPAQHRVMRASAFMACTGLYWCELLEVRWRNIQRGTDSEGVGCWQYVYPRNKGEGRQSRINRSTPVILNDNALQLIGQRGADDELIFPQTGRTTTNVRSMWSVICRKAGIDKHITSGSFRHMKGEQMAADGATDIEIANQMGHCNTIHTLRYTKRAKANAKRVAGNLY